MGVFLTSLWLFCVLEPAIFTFCSHHIATDHSPEQMPNVHLQLSPHSYRFCAGLSSVPPLLALRIQAGCVSLVLLINLSGTRPLSHNNGFTELTTLHSLCTPPDALPTLPGQGAAFHSGQAAFPARGQFCSFLETMQPCLHCPLSRVAPQHLHHCIFGSTAIQNQIH